MSVECDERKWWLPRWLRRRPSVGNSQGIVIHDVPVTQDDVKALEKYWFDVGVKLQGAWLVALGVANGGGIVALSGVLVANLDKPLAQLLLPSAWGFAIGLACTGAALWIDQIRAHLMTWHYRRQIGILQDPMQVAHRVVGSSMDQKAFVLSNAVEISGSLAFLFGLLYPLAVLTKRLVLTGSLLG